MFAARVTTPLASILNGPVVIGVTSVLAAVTNCAFNVSLAVTFRTVVGVVPVLTVTGASFIASIGLETTIVTVAVSQFNGFAPTSHNWYVIV